MWSTRMPAARRRSSVRSGWTVRCPSPLLPCGSTSVSVVVTSAQCHPWGGTRRADFSHGAHERDRLAVVPGRALDQRARRQHGARHATRDQEQGQSERDGSRAANMARCPSRYAALFTGPAAGGAPATILRLARPFTAPGVSAERLTADLVPRRGWAEARPGAPAAMAAARRRPPCGARPHPLRDR